MPGSAVKVPEAGADGPLIWEMSAHISRTAISRGTAAEGLPSGSNFQTLRLQKVWRELWRIQRPSSYRTKRRVISWSVTCRTSSSSPYPVQAVLHPQCAPHGTRERQGTETARTQRTQIIACPLLDLSVSLDLGFDPADHGQVREPGLGDQSAGNCGMPRSIARLGRPSQRCHS
jgi:hypothetical protein